MVAVAVIAAAATVVVVVVVVAVGSAARRGHRRREQTQIRRTDHSRHAADRSDVCIGEQLQNAFNAEINFFFSRIIMNE